MRTSLTHEVEIVTAGEDNVENCDEIEIEDTKTKAQKEESHRNQMLTRSQF